MTQSSRRFKRATADRSAVGVPVSPIGRRATIVWVSLIASMTVACGGLMLISGNPMPRVDGLSLSPLAAASIDRRSQHDPVLVTREAIDAERWQAVVIHHSGHVDGTPASIEREHLSRNIERLGHHFIIGNGQGMEDGQLHIGYRWLDQLPGAHVVGENGAWYNNHSISICLVGDGNRQPFTAAQLDRLNGLIDSLCASLNISRDRIVLHSQIAPVSDPGKLFPWSGAAAPAVPGSR